MEIPQKDTSKKQVCSITAIFPVDNDDEAIEYKKQITSILSNIKFARIEFKLTEITIPDKEDIKPNDP